MKYIVAVDEDGFKRRYCVRDTDGDDDARAGIPAGPPDLDVIDWHALKREINNRLVDAGIFDLESLRKSPEGVNVVATAVKQWVLAAFKDDQTTRKAVIKKLNGG